MSLAIARKNVALAVLLEAVSRIMDRRISHKEDERPLHDAQVILFKLMDDVQHDRWPAVPAPSKPKRKRAGGSR